MDKDNLEPRSELEQRCREYVRAVYRAGDWTKSGSRHLAFTILLALINCSTPFLAIHVLLELHRGVAIPLAVLLIFAPFVLLLLVSERLKADARQYAVKRLRQEHHLASASFNQVRAELLCKLLRTHPRTFVETASTLKKLLDLRQSITITSNSGFTWLFHTVYDPASKPRILALTGVLVALFVAATRTPESMADAAFSVIGAEPAGNLAALALVGVILWVLMLAIGLGWELIERLFLEMDKRASTTAHVQLVMRDLLNLSKV